MNSVYLGRAVYYRISVNEELHGFSAIVNLHNSEVTLRADLSYIEDGRTDDGLKGCVEGIYYKDSATNGQWDKLKGDEVETELMYHILVQNKMIAEEELIQYIKDEDIISKMIEGSSSAEEDRRLWYIISTVKFGDEDGFDKRVVTIYYSNRDCIRTMVIDRFSYVPGIEQVLSERGINSIVEAYEHRDMGVLKLYASTLFVGDEAYGHENVIHVGEASVQNTMLASIMQAYRGNHWLPMQVIVEEVTELNGYRVNVYAE